MKHEKVVKETITTERIDGETGELKSSETKKTYSIAKEPSFVKLYLKDLASIYQLSKSSILVLLGLLPFATYADEGQIVTINSHTKKQILFNNQEIGSTQTVNNAVSHLKKIGVLTLIDRATYKLNPYIIGKGEWRDILNLRLTINYSAVGREIVTEITTDAGKQKMQVPDFKESTDTEKSTSTDTTMTPETEQPITGVMTSRMSETETIDSTESTVNTEVTETPRTTNRKGKQPLPKPDNWQEVKAKIISKEITKVQALKELGIKTVVTLNKWLAESAA